MSVSIKLDTGEFTAAMRDYVAVTKKDSAHAINRQMLNFSIKGMQHTKVAEASAIQKVSEMHWWPAYVAKAVGRMAGKTAAKEAYQAMWAHEEVDVLNARSGRKGAMMDRKERSYYKFASALSRRMIRSRLKAVKFMRFFFLSIARELSRKAGVGNAPQGKTFGDMVATVAPATPNNLTCSVSARYDYVRRTAKTSHKAERLLQTYLDKALPATIADMKNYISDQLAKRARQLSGRKAA